MRYALYLESKGENKLKNSLKDDLKEEIMPPPVYLIKDLVRLTGYSIHTLKYYLKIGLIKEVSRSPETHFRYFDDSTAEQLKKIRALRREGRSIREIKEELV